jgi:hypothetical protein
MRIEVNKKSLAFLFLEALIAIPAIDRANTRRLERNLCFRAAIRANGRVILALTASAGLLFARAAAFRTPRGFVLESFLRVKSLFLGAKNKFRAAFFAY